PSPRRLTPAAARELIRGAMEARRPETWETGEHQRRRPLTIGVFGDTSAEEIAAVTREVDLDGVQLHGLAGPGGDAVRRALGGRDRPLLVIRAVPVDPESGSADLLAQAIVAARREADVVLVDTKGAGRFGGSGRSFAWSLVRDAAGGGPLLVAGGIGPENVQAALRESGAWGVDVSSGIEQSPGVKDLALMGQVVAKVGAIADTGAWVWARACPGMTAGAGATLPPGAAVCAGGEDPSQEG
ncbi:MAG: phosphoribosylanthranilate isomerase, partial [Thermoleophilia bacterium]|nr:phosphoribosylanthranilate isomerase [Thermoleophilia bacterium]